MTLRLVFDRDDLQRVRIATRPDPMWELVLSLHQIRERKVAEQHVGWQRRTRLRVRETADVHRWLTPLFTLIPVRGDFPDFLTPTPSVSSVESGIDELHRTPARRLHTDLTAAFSGHTPPVWLRELAAGERHQLDGVTRAVRRAHDLLLAPDWDTVCATVRADRTRRSHDLADSGLGGVMARIPGVRGWDGTTLEIDYPRSRSVHLAGRGITLLPSYFCVDRPVTLIDPELPPILIYPATADGRAERTISADSTHLDALLSRTRAECLGALTIARTTSALAHAVGVSIPTASKQATVLREARLVESVREGNSVRHHATELGMALLAGRVR